MDERTGPVQGKGSIIIIGFLLLLAGLIAPVSSSDAHFFVKGGKNCRPVVYQWGTDWASSAIQVRGVGCRKARAWIRRNQGSWDGIPWENCVRRIRNRGDRWAGIGHTDYRCVSPDGSKKIVWINT